ncbi:hypothetical protein X474_21560 [Dethiosulfatarculus sandiegensis]|uniref:Uncharacterized protein n=1 Tax=Dethiosulfatarculus sandiegensis TaxID=1429043 RepID=A0A0D2JR04_9BACT|nr:hypothetical protein X474_21560 [Dethiosulfatarculus sandiegensis]
MARSRAVDKQPDCSILRGEIFLFGEATGAAGFADAQAEEESARPAHTRLSNNQM